MDRKDFQLILDHLDINSDDIRSFAENWPQVDVFVSGKPETVKSNVKHIEITMNSGRKYYLKMNYLNKIIRTADEPGFDFMVE